MKFIVHGVTQGIVSMEVEADNAEEAANIAVCSGSNQWDVWDSDVSVTHVNEM